jgi:ABC-type transport system substrate-binding protein
MEAATAIIPEGTTEFGKSWREGVAGTGPFRVVRFDPGRRIELEANRDYWRTGYPKCDRLTFYFNVPPQDILTGFKNGSYSLATDLLPSDVESLRREKGAIQYLEVPNLSTYFVALNIHHGPLSDEAIRKQIVESIDFERLVRNSIGRLGIPAHSLIPPGLLGYEPAQKHSGKIRKEKPNTNINLTCLLHPVYDGPYSSLLNRLLSAFDQNGFHVNVLQNRADVESIRRGEADIAIIRWMGDYPDPDTFANGGIHTMEGVAGAFCGKPEIDRLIDQGRSETDPRVRHSIYREIEEIIKREALLVPLFHEQTYRFARPEVEGLELRFSIPYVAYENLSIRR